MGIFLANRDAPSRCTATDCLVFGQHFLSTTNSCLGEVKAEGTSVL